MFDLKKFEELYLEPSKNGISRSSLNNGEGVKIVNMGELFWYPRMKNPEMRKVITSEKENKTFGLEADDLLFARRSLVAEGAGKCNIILEVENPTVFESSIIRVRLNKEISNPLFYYYYFNSQIGFIAIQTLVNEVAASGIRSSELAKLKVIYPKLEIQNQIASILNCYDELIETNNQRIRLLEETAQQLYKEWFVRMRFPNYKKTKFVKGTPEGWEINKVANLLNRHKFGKTYKNNELELTGAVVVIDQSTDELLGYHNNDPDHIASSNSPMIIFGDHTCKMQLMVEPFSLAENVIPVSSKGNTPIYFLYYLINSLVETTEYKRHWNELISKTVLLPSEPLQKKYADLVQPFFEQINNLNKQNIELRNLKDRLLPRLISGKLQIKEKKELKKTELVK